MFNEPVYVRTRNETKWSQGWLVLNQQVHVHPGNIRPCCGRGSVQANDSAIVSGTDYQAPIGKPVLILILTMARFAALPIINSAGGRALGRTLCVSEAR